MCTLIQPVLILCLCSCVFSPRSGWFSLFMVSLYKCDTCAFPSFISRIHTFRLRSTPKVSITRRVCAICNKNLYVSFLVCFVVSNAKWRDSIGLLMHLAFLCHKKVHLRHVPFSILDLMPGTLFLLLLLWRERERFLCCCWLCACHLYDIFQTEFQMWSVRCQIQTGKNLHTNIHKQTNEQPNKSVHNPTKGEEIHCIIFGDRKGWNSTELVYVRHMFGYSSLLICRARYLFFLFTSLAAIISCDIFFRFS